MFYFLCFFFFQAEDGIRDGRVTGVQTCALPILSRQSGASVLCISPWRKFLPSLTYPQKIRRNWFVGNRLREPRSRWPCAAGWFWPLQKDIPIWKSLPTTKSIDTLSRCGESACKPQGSARSGRSKRVGGGK